MVSVFLKSQRLSMINKMGTPNQGAYQPQQPVYNPGMFNNYQQQYGVFT